MVAVIHSSSSLRNALNYNEQKVAHGQAKCLEAVNYPKDVEHLSFYQKLHRLQNQANLNIRTKVNSVHISLNFDPSEKLSDEKLKEIAGTYLEKIGFAKQPYLVYAHYDAGHPHIHIVTINIKTDGRRIELHNLGKIQSEKARKEIELAYGLKRAADSKQRQVYELKPVNVQKVQYGKSETKRAITNVLDAVLNTYKYTSLPELNAILQQYNVIADRGNETSRVYQNKGLTYRIIDENGNKLGVPIKASDFYNKPTLKLLEAKFSQNETARQRHKARVKNTIDLSLLRNLNPSLQSLIKTLEKDGIAAVLRQNKEGVIYGVTYVDHWTKCVFNGSALGKPYSAKGIQERCNEAKEQPLQKQGFVKQPSLKTISLEEQRTAPAAVLNKDGHTLLETLLQVEHTSGYIPYQLIQKGGKKRKKQVNKHL